MRIQKTMIGQKQFLNDLVLLANNDWDCKVGPRFDTPDAVLDFLKHPPLQKLQTLASIAHAGSMTTMTRDGRFVRGRNIFTGRKGRALAQKLKCEIADWFVTAYPLISLYSVMIDNLGQPLVRSRIRRCGFEKCRRYFVLKDSRGPLQQYCRAECRISRNNAERLADQREWKNKQKAIKLAKKPGLLSEEEKRELERIMTLKYFMTVFKRQILKGRRSPELPEEIKQRMRTPQSRLKRSGG